jgi:exosome complex component RRP41
MLDLTLLEENDIPNVTVAVMPRTGQVTLVTMESRLHVDRFEEIFVLACDAGKVIHREMKFAVNARVGKLVEAMGLGARFAARDVDDVMNEY